MRSIRISESELVNLIEESVRNALNEMSPAADNKESFILKAKAKHPIENYDYSKVVYNGSKNPVEIICPQHGSFMQRPTDHLSGCGCWRCKMPHLERVVESELVALGVNYTPRYRDSWLLGQHLDFFLDDYKVGIECQGIQHFKPVPFFGGKVKLFVRQKLDMIKRIKCISQNVQLEYIDYTDSDDMIKQKIRVVISSLKKK